MRRLPFVALATLFACGGSSGNHPTDAPNHQIDAPNPDGPIDGAPDAPPATDGIAGALGTPDGTGLTLPITNVMVTYEKPALGNTTNDPAGFTIQAQQHGPALFVSVDPATLTPVPAVGDTVSFTITTMGTVGMERRAQAITSFAQGATGGDVTPLVQDLSAATDVVSGIDGYDGELVDLTGSFTDAFASSGQGFQRSTITSAGITGDTNFQFRAPSTLVDSLDMVPTCGFTLHHVPVGRFNTSAEIPAYVAGDITLTACPAPTVVSAISLSPQTVRITFSRNVLDGSVMPDGSQFTFDNGLTAMAATVSGRTVTVMTSTQAGGTNYTATVATTVTDLLGSALATPNTGLFAGFTVAAVVRINEVNANITGGCDLIELRVISGGSMAGYKIQERGGAAGELAFTFPTFNVQTNDFIVIHENSGSTTCNPNTATSETMTITDQPAAMFAGNYDTAYDFWNTDTGLTATDNVFTLYDAAGNIMDALFASNDPTATATASATENQAALVGAANQWSPAMATYIDAVFRMNAVADLDATATTAAGTSIQRIDDNDTNSVADWTTGAGVASTFGALNPGQTAF